MNGTPLQSTKNSTFQLQQKVVKNKSFRRQEGLVWLEGLRAVSQCPPEQIKALFLGPKAPEKSDWPTPPYILSEELARKCFQTENPQEVGALLHWKDAPLESLDWTKGVMILDGLQDPGNTGTLLRTAAAFDLGGLILLNSVECGNPKFLRSSAGCLFSIPVAEHHNIRELQNYLKDHGIELYMADAGGSSEGLPPPTGAFAFVIGGEANGLSDGWKGHVWTLPLANGVESLNAAVAGSLLTQRLKG